MFTKKKPKHQHIPTRHLMILFADKDDIEKKFKDIVVHSLDEVRTVVSFSSEVDAASAKKDLLEKNEKAQVFFCESSLEPSKPVKEKIESVGFELTSDAPEGLILVKDFVSAEEEAELLKFLDGQTWDEGIKRRVQHYGFAFDYTTRSVNPSFSAVTEIPEIFQKLFQRLVDAGVPHMPDQITVNEYTPGIGIKPHVDTHSAFTDGISSLSLGSAVAFDMREQPNPSPNNGNNNNEVERRYSVGLLPRSLLIMTGESRYSWVHGISARKTDVFDGELKKRGRRISITFRKVLDAGAECRCKWVHCCESQSSLELPPVPIEEKKGVVDFYTRIADHFSLTRHTPWPKVIEFVSQAKKAETLLDCGCGNGRHILAARDSGVVVFGCDIISRFVEICKKERKLEALVSDALCLPYRSAVFDRVICIAVIHHLSTRERRLRALQELTRVASLKGLILVTVWAFEQDQDSKRKFDAQDVTVPWVLPAEHDPERVKEYKEAFVDGKKKKKLPSASVDRYCHVFKEGELEQLIQCLPNVQIVSSYYDNSNWACIFKKVAL